MLIETAVLCLALNIYFEARSEPIMGQYSVALVTMNRARWNDSKVCKEVFKPYQFSWTNEGVYREGNGWRVGHRLTPREKHAWWVATKIAENTLSGRMPDVTNGSTHYHTKAVKPAWATPKKQTRTMGSHVFYALN